MAKNKLKATIRTVGELAALKVPNHRPTLYDPKYIEMMMDYFNVKPYEKNQLLGKLEAADFPSLSGFAIKIGVDSDTLLNWSKQYPDFFGAYKKARDFQTNFIVVNGMKDLINPAIAIFTAKNVLNWRDKSDLEVTGKPFDDLSDEELEKLYQEKVAKK